MPTEEQERSVEKYENELKSLINDEIEYEKNENSKKLIKRISAKKTDEKETIRHLICTFKNYAENPRQVKFKSNDRIDAEINELDRVLITDENFHGMNQEGIVVKIKSNEIIIEYSKDNFIKPDISHSYRIDLYVKEGTYNRQLENLKPLSPDGKYALHFALKHIDPENYKNQNKNIEFYDSELNTSQREAVFKSLNSKHFFLIHGPFGTGKTKTLVEIIRQEALVKEKILITADSNAAVDNIAEILIDTDLNILRIGNSRKISDTINEHSLSVQTKKHPCYSKVVPVTPVSPVSPVISEFNKVIFLGLLVTPTSIKLIVSIPNVSPLSFNKTSTLGDRPFPSISSSSGTSINSFPLSSSNTMLFPMPM